MINRGLRRWSWWTALAGILLGAAVVRYVGYNFSLPYVDHPDEAVYNLAGRMVIDFGSPMPLGMHGYPPGIIAVNMVLLRAFHNPADPPSTVLWIIRLLSITFSVAALIVVAITLRRLGSPFAGLIAAFIWGGSPLAVEYSRYATADSFVTFFSLLALSLTLIGTRERRKSMIDMGVYAIMLAIVFKYQAVLLLPLVVAIPLTQWFGQGTDRRVWVRAWAANLFKLGLFFFWLIVLFPALEADQSPYWSASGTRFSIPTPQTIAANLRMVTRIASNVFWLIGFSGLLLLFVPNIRRRVSLLAAGGIGGGALLWMIGVSFYGPQGQEEFRQFITAAVLLATLAAFGVNLWTLALVDGLASRLKQIPERARISVGYAAVALLVLILHLPQVRGSIANARQHTLPDRRNDLAHYMNASLPSGGYISNLDNHKTFNRDWGGYTGDTSFPHVQTAVLGTQSVAYWREQGVTYAIVSWDDYQTLLARDDYQAELAQTLVLKQYPHDPNYRDRGMLVLRLTPIQTPLTEPISLGGVAYLGYDLEDQRVRAGESMTFTLYWRAEQRPTCDAAVFNHLVDASGEIVAQIDGVPVSLLRPTTTWDDPTETLVSQPFTLVIPDDMPAGDYTLRTGLYCRDSGARLSAADGSDFVPLFTLNVEGT